MDKNVFLAQYQESILDKLELPEKIELEYILISCLKQLPEKSVYLMKSKANGKKYILKKVAEKYGDSLYTEYNVCGSLNHKDVAKVINIFDENGYVYLIREYIEGNTLLDLVENKGCFSETDTIKGCIQLCEILEYLHNQYHPVIHRDIKPQNIIVTPEGRYKLIDLETSRHYKPEETQDTVFMGTQITAAPEQFGYRQTDARSDIYALGVLMVYMLTEEYIIDHMQLSKIAAPLRGVIKKCLAFDPINRFKNVSTLKKRLIYILNRNRIIKKTCLYIGLLTLVCVSSLWGMKHFSSPPLPQYVSFTEPIIEKAVRLELGKAVDEPITLADLKAVEQILICGDEILLNWNRHRQYCQFHYINEEINDTKGTISDISDIAMMPHLKRLMIDNQNIVDLTPLENLPLEQLSLSGNKIKDITSLSNCKKLKQLWLESNEIVDLSSLSGLDQLQLLDIGFNPFSDLTPLNKLKIEELYMIETYVDNFAPLKDMPLKTFAVRYLSHQGLTIVSNKTSLLKLTIYESDIDSFIYFENLVELRELDLNSNNISDLSGVEKLEHLVHIGLGQNDLGSLAPLAELKNLESIDIVDSSVLDLSELKNLTHLNYINCDSGQIDTLRDYFRNSDVMLSEQ